MPISAVLLDAGGVLYLPDHSIARSAANELGVEIDDNNIDRAHYAGAATFRPITVDADPHEVFWDDYLIAYAAVLGLPQHGISLLRQAFLLSLIHI